MWGMRRRAGPEEQIPRDRSNGRMRQPTKYPLSEDCGSQNNLNGCLSPSGPSREASRRLLLREGKADRFCSMGAFPLMALHVILMRRWTRSWSGCSRHGLTERRPLPIVNDPERKSRLFKI